MTRHPAIAALRAGRSRSSNETLLWLDTAEGTFDARGEIVERRRRGPDCIAQSLPPPDAFWVPASPLVANSDQPVGCEALVAMAAFEGRRLVIPLGDGLRAALLAGKLCAVAGEEPVARLILSGTDQHVLRLAGELAADLPLLPPAASLAEAGRALSRGTVPRPRRQGPPNLADSPTVESALRGAIGHLLEVVLRHAPACRPEAGPEAVHQARVGVRRLRSILRTFRGAADCPALRHFDDGLKALAGRFAPARDWDVFLNGVGAAAASALSAQNQADKRFGALLRCAEQERDLAYEALWQTLGSGDFRLLIIEGLTLIHTTPWREPPAGVDPDERALRLEQPLRHFAVAALRKRWRRLCRNDVDIEKLAANLLHELRLDTKRLRYAAELFAPLFPGKQTRRFLRRLSAVQEDLGSANDSAVARALAASLAGRAPAWAIGAVEGFAAARDAGIRGDSLESWHALLKAEPFWEEN